MVSSEEDIVTLIPRFVITQGEPPIQRSQSNEDARNVPDETPTLLPEDCEDLWAPAPSDVSQTLLPADVEDYPGASRLPARSMLRRLPSLLD